MAKKDRVTPRLLKGMQDAWPPLARARQRMLAEIAQVCERFGFLPFDTPTMEAVETLLGPEPTKEQLAGIFQFANYDGEQVGLRYEMTGSLARVVSQYRQDLALPFRRFQFGNAFRWDKPEPGRFREFLSFDIDIVGTSSMAADAEMIAVIDEILRQLGIEGYAIRMSNRKLLDALGQYAGLAPAKARNIYRVIDKVDRFDRARIRLELGPGLVDQSGDKIPGLGLNPEEVAKVDEFLDLPRDAENEVVLAAGRDLLGSFNAGEEGVTELEQVLEYLPAFGVSPETVRVDLHLARGLGYYTGPVFEVTLAALPAFGSILGGGRYDGLIGRFLGESQDIPATGAAFGPDRLLAALKELGKLDQAYTSSQVLVTVMDQQRLQEYIAMTRELREAGINAEVYLGRGNIGKQLKYADRLGIPLAVIAGEDEFAQGLVSIKDLELGRELAQQTAERDEWKELKQQETIPRSNLTERVVQLLQS
jgi:histidyl-tRNA synthetase